MAKKDKPSPKVEVARPEPSRPMEPVSVRKRFTESGEGAARKSQPRSTRKGKK